MKNQSKILIIDDDQDVLLSARMVLKKHIDIIRTSSEPSNLEEYLNREEYDVILLDMNFTIGALSGKEGLHWLRKIKDMSPSTQVILMTAFGDVDLAVKAMKDGASDFIVKPWENKRLVATVKNVIELGKARKKVSELKAREKDIIKTISQPRPDIIGESEGMIKVYKTVEKVAGTDVNILILGENGTGKEVLARAIHERSNRADQIFVNVDLGAVTESLFESELFGHKKGSFTDAKEDRAGRFELANKGSLFLDEIGNLSLPLQAKLLTVLQRREVVRVGENSPRSVDIRLICATNMPLYSMVNEQQFREDLLYRINTVEIQLPPLRERQVDIPILTRRFMEQYSRKYQKLIMNISDRAIEKLRKYQWPGNIRELQHVIERAVIMSDAEILDAEDIVLQHKHHAAVKNAPEVLNLEELEKQAIVKALEKHEGNMSMVAKELGLGRTTLYRKLAKYDL
jgi:DNA-binding NtrC family response regulator